MKKIITITLTVMALALQAQERHFFVELGIDTKMALVGPYKDQPNDIGTTFNAELRIGIQSGNSLFGAGYESHQAIKYEKWTVFYEYQLSDKLLFIDLRKVNTRAGIEAGMIIRQDPPEDYRAITHDWVQMGANFGVYYELHHNGNDTGFEVGINANTFRGEEHYRSYADTFIETFRTDVMVVLKRNF